MAESSESTTSTNVSPDEGYSGFSEGDLGRLQGILFGDHAKQTHERIDTLEKALLGALSDMKSEISGEISALEKRIVAEEENRSTAVANLSDRVSADAKANKAATRKLQQGLDKGTEKLAKAIDDAVTDQRLELDATRRDLAAQIEATETELSESSVGRSQLAAALSQVADELKR